MATQTEIQGLVDEIIRKRKHRRVPVKRACEKLKEFLNDLDALEQHLRSGGVDASTDDSIKNFDVQNLREKASKALENMELALHRLAHDTIRIGVAGRARSGKSTLLKSISGLDDTAIPARGGTFCTAARSEIINSNHTDARINFWTEDKFFKNIVLPYFDELNITPPPADLGVFLRESMSAWELARDAGARDKELYNVLSDMHQNTSDVRYLMKGEKKQISINEVNGYVTKDQGDKKYLAVRKAVIETPFKIDKLPKQISLIDLPGMGELALNIKKEMMGAIAKDADAVIIVRKPQGSGDDWGEDDFGIIDIIGEAAPDLKSMIPDWVVLALNQSNIPGDQNSAVVKIMVNSAQQGKNHRLGGIEVLPCDCSNENDVRDNLVVKILDKLTTKVSVLDEIRVREARKAADALCKDLHKKIKSLRSAVAIPPTSPDVKFLDLVDECFTSLKESRDILKKVRTDKQTDDSIKAGLKDELSVLLSQLEGVIGHPEKAIDGYQRWPVDRIRKLLIKYEGEATGRDDAATKTRVALSELLAANLDPLFRDVVQRYKDRVRDAILERTELLQRWFNIKKVDPMLDPDFFGTFNRMVPDVCPLLKKAFTRMSDFAITYDAEIHPLVRQKLAPLDPDDPAYIFYAPQHGNNPPPVDTLEQKARNIIKSLDTAAHAIVKKITSDMDQQDLRITDTLYQTGREFFDQILWATSSEHEWKVLFEESKRELMDKEYKAYDRSVTFMADLKKLADKMYSNAEQIVSSDFKTNYFADESEETEYVPVFDPDATQEEIRSEPDVEAEISTPAKPAPKPAPDFASIPETTAPESTPAFAPEPEAAAPVDEPIAPEPEADDLYTKAVDLYAQQQYTDAAAYFQRAAQQNHPQSLYYLGYMRYEGQGLPKDTAQAKSLFRLAANLGLAEAQHALESIETNSN